MTIIRQPVPDLMKGIAVIAMIQVHIMELFARPDLFESLVGKISLFIGGPFAAPVFMAVMGYFMAGSKRRTGEKVKRGIYLILLGLILNIGLNLHLLIKIYSGIFDLNPLEYIFGADILPLAGLSILVVVLLETFSNRPLLHALMIAVLIPTLHSFLPDLPEKVKYIQAFFYGDYAWSYFPLLPWLAYPLLGYGFYKFKETMPAESERLNRSRTVILIISFIIIILLFLPAFKIVTDLPSYYHHQVFLFAWIAIFLVIFTWLAEQLESYFGQIAALKYLKWLGKNITVFYVVQWLIIGNIATAIYKTQHLLNVIIWFVAILGIVSLVTYGSIKLRNKFLND